MKIQEDLKLKDIYASVVGYYQLREYGECLKKIDVGLRWPGLDNDDIHDFYFYKACCEDELGFYRQAYESVKISYGLVPGCADCEELYKDIVIHMGKEIERLFYQGVDLERAREMMNALSRDELFADEYQELARKLSDMENRKRNAHYHSAQAGAGGKWDA